MRWKKKRGKKNEKKTGNRVTTTTTTTTQGVRANKYIYETILLEFISSPSTRDTRKGGVRRLHRPSDRPNRRTSCNSTTSCCCPDAWTTSRPASTSSVRNLRKQFDKILFLKLYSYCCVSDGCGARAACTAHNMLLNDSARTNRFQCEINCDRQKT